MLGTLAKLFTTGQVKWTEKGEFYILGKRVIGIYFEPFEGMVDYLKKSLGESEGEKAAYSVAKAGAKRYIKDIVVDKMGYKGEEAIDFAGELASVSGWGKITVSSFDGNKKEATVVVEKSPFTVTTSDHPSCHFLRGMFAGSASVIWNSNIECVETACAATRKSEYCEFVLKKREKFKDKALVKKQLPAK